jgi:hypothetical protein
MCISIMMPGIRINIFKPGHHNGHKDALWVYKAQKLKTNVIYEF